jgi:hypothetical protein
VVNVKPAKAIKNTENLIKHNLYSYWCVFVCLIHQNNDCIRRIWGPAGDRQSHRRDGVDVSLFYEFRALSDPYVVFLQIYKLRASPWF